MYNICNIHWFCYYFNISPHSCNKRKWKVCLPAIIAWTADVSGHKKPLPFPLPTEHSDLRSLQILPLLRGEAKATHHPKLSEEAMRLLMVLFLFESLVTIHGRPQQGLGALQGGFDGPTTTGQLLRRRTIVPKFREPEPYVPKKSDCKLQPSSIIPWPIGPIYLPSIKGCLSEMWSYAKLYAIYTPLDVHALGITFGIILVVHYRLPRDSLGDRIEKRTEVTYNWSGI